MTEPATDAVVPKADVALLLSVVRERFLNLDADESNAIVLAMQGLAWLIGQDSAVTRAKLEEEQAYWDEHSLVRRAR